MGVTFMNEKELYYFYFDESNRNGNIRFKNGLPNFWHKSEGIQRETNYYVGCYLGWSANNRESALTEYQELEKQSKTLLFPGTDTELGELKSQKIRANYKYGLKTFTSKYIKFYTSLFNYLLETDAIFQLNIIAPFEILMSDGLEFTFKKPHSQKIIREFRYSITKFLQNYADNEVMSCLEDFLSTNDAAKFKTATISKLHSVIEWGSGVERKSEEVAVLAVMLEMLEECTISIKNYPIKFNYMIDALGFKATLLERNIPSNCAIIQIDNEKDTKKAIESEFKNVTEVDSKDCTGVRICDIVAGFVCNMLKAIPRALNPNESALDDEKANAQLCILSKDWFDITEEQFALYKTIGNYLAADELPYYTVTTGKYADDVAMLFSLLHYFKKFKDYENYKRRNLSKHVKEFHSFSMQRMQISLCDL